MSAIEIETPHGPARAHLSAVPDARGALLMGHGAGGGVEAADLQATRDAALAAGVTVALVEQPYRVAGRRAPAPARQLDAAWLAVVERLTADAIAGLPLVVGGRSLGARVACRSAAEVGAVGVLCVAFPVQPPARKGREPAPSRLPELDAPGLPTLVVQGSSDQFGVPPEGPARRVVLVAGNHSPTRELDALMSAVTGWLGELFD